MSVTVSKVLGKVSDDRYANRRIEDVAIAWQDATTSRQRTNGSLGSDVVIDLPRGIFLAHGDVLAELDDRILVVTRVEENVLVVRPKTVAQAAAIGHAYGNQHVPLQISSDEIVVPITTSAGVVSTTAAELDVEHELCRRRPFSHTPPKRAAASGLRREPPTT